ncbi:hypothetical protein HY970_01115 [Candidatus Kaiserbacteria bacterium]|nr:hypothetical protein [Candidatus Kaiserbacteria bacterium]
MSAPRAIFASFAIAFIAPLLAGAQTTQAPQAGVQTVNYSFQRDGIFGCNRNNSYSQSVGSQVAIQGVYVPVSDAAVTLNTGILVYKECILREVLNRQKEAAASAYDRQMQLLFTTGRDGKPLFYQSGKEQLEARDAGVLNGLQSGVLATVNPTIRGTVERAVAKGYVTNTRRGNTVLSCAYTDLAGLYSGRPKGSIIDALEAVQNPACDPLYAYESGRQVIGDIGQNRVDEMLLKLGWYQGTYARETLDAYGNPVVNTPGSIILQNEILSLQSGYTQLRNANDIGQMVGALYAGIANQAVADTQGLLGLTQASSGQLSYLDRLAQESSTGLRNAAANAALQTLLGAQEIERVYGSAMNAIAATLAGAISSLRGAESKCWDLIIQNVCASTPTGGKCSGKSGNQLKIATSTQFSQPIVDDQIRPLAETTANNITVSQNALTLIGQLIAGVTNTASITAQRLALQQIDMLISQRRLHNSADVQQAQQSQSAVKQSMDTLVSDTVKLWGDSTDATKGWCNVNNAAVIDRWDRAWR